MITTRPDPVSWWLIEGYIDGVFHGLFSSEESAIAALSKKVGLELVEKDRE